jgi:hypothetical protein
MIYQIKLYRTIDISRSFSYKVVDGSIINHVCLCYISNDLANFPYIIAGQNTQTPRRQSLRGRAWLRYIYLQYRFSFCQGYLDVLLFNISQRREWFFFTSTNTVSWTLIPVISQCLRLISALEQVLLAEVEICSARTPIA